MRVTVFVQFTVVAWRTLFRCHFSIDVSVALSISLSQDAIAMRHLNGSIDQLGSWSLTAVPNVLLLDSSLCQVVLQQSYLNVFFAGITNANQPVSRSHLFEGEKMNRE